MLVLSPDGKSLAYDARDEILLWNLESAALTRIAKNQKGFVRLGAAFFPDGQTIVSYGPGGSIQAYPVTGTAKPRVLVLAPDDAMSRGICDFALSPDGKLLVVGSMNGKLTLWDAARARVMTHLSGHSMDVSDVRFTPDGKRLISGSYQEGWIVRNLAAHETAESKIAPKTTIAVSPDGALVGLAGEETGSSSGFLVREFGKEGDRCSIASSQFINKAAFSPDGKRVAICSGNPKEVSLRVYAVPTGEELLVILNRKGSIAAVTFSRDGSQLFGAGSTTTGNGVHVWESATGKELKLLPLK